MGQIWDFLRSVFSTFWFTEVVFTDGSVKSGEKIDQGYTVRVNDLVVENVKVQLHNIQQANENKGHHRSFEMVSS